MHKTNKQLTALFELPFYCYDLEFGDEFNVPDMRDELKNCDCVHFVRLNDKTNRILHCSLEPKDGCHYHTQFANNIGGLDHVELTYTDTAWVYLNNGKRVELEGQGS